MTRRAIPVLGLEEYRRFRPEAGEFAVETMEGSFLHHPHRSQAHTHPFFQVFLTNCACSLMLDFVDYAVEAQTLIFSSPGQVHSLIPTGTISGWFISFSQAFFDGDTPPPSHLLHYPFFFSTGAHPFMQLGADDARWCVALFQELMREGEAGQPGMQVIARAYLQILFTRAARLYGAPEQPPSQSRPLAHRYRLAVEEHFATHHLLTDYAALLKVTPNHLNDAVRLATGSSAGSMLRERQLLEAKRLLLHSPLTISEIAYRLGFKDPSYFSRFFRRMAQLSPGAFREAIREKYPTPPDSHP